MHRILLAILGLAFLPIQISAQCPANTFGAEAGIAAPRFGGLPVGTRDQPNNTFGPLEGIDAGDFFTLEDAPSGPIYQITSSNAMTQRDENGNVIQGAPLGGSLIVQNNTVGTPGADTDRDFFIYLEGSVCGGQGTGPDALRVECTTCQPIRSTLPTVAVTPGFSAPIFVPYSNYDPDVTISTTATSEERDAWKNWYNPFGNSPGLVSVARSGPVFAAVPPGEDQLNVSIRDATLNGAHYDQIFGTDGWGVSLLTLNNGFYSVVDADYQRRTTPASGSYGFTLNPDPADGISGYYVCFWRAERINETFGFSTGTFTYPNNVGEFEFNLSTPPPPPPAPPADLCANAFSVTPFTGTACGELDSIYTAYSRDESAGTPSCVNGDVWLSFVAASTQHLLYLENTGQFQYDMGIELSTGACGARTPVQCERVVSGGTAQLRDLTIGQTYLLRLSNATDGSPQRAPEDRARNFVRYCLAGPTLACTSGRATVISDTCLNQQSVTLVLDVTDLGGQTDLELIDTLFNESYGAVTATGQQTFTVPSGDRNLQLRGAESLCYSEIFNINNFCAYTSNDLCEDAFDVPLSAADDPATIRASSRRTTLGAPNLTGCGGAGDADMWFTVTNPGSDPITVALTMTTISEVLETYVYYLYSGTCTGLNYEDCTEASSTTAGIGGGETLYLRAVRTESRLSGFETGITVSASTITGQDNEACVLATPVTVSPDLSCTAPVSEDNANAISRVLYYSFVPVEDRVTFSLLAGNPDLENLVYDVIDACPGASLGSGTVGVGGAVEIGGLTPGDTYYLELRPAVSRDVASYTFCLATPPPNATNSVPDDAITVPINPPGSCAATTPGTTYGAEQWFSSCLGGVRDDDVFFKFTATSTAVDVELLNIQQLVGAPDDIIVQVGFFTPGGGFTTRTCQRATSLTASGLNVGQEVFISVYTAAADAAISFDLCVAAIDAPVNDECSDAIALAATPLGDCSQSVTGTVIGADGSPEGLADCPNTSTSGRDDVWFTISAAADVGYLLSLDGQADTDIAVWEGTCGALGANLTCREFGQYLIPAGPARDLVVRLALFEFSLRKNYTICLNELPTAVPPNDVCTAAADLPVDAVGSCTGTAGTTLNASSTLPDCDGGPIGEDVWYRFTAASAQHYLEIANLRSAVGPGFPQISYELFSGTCGSLVSVRCVTVFEGGVSDLLQGLSAGEPYYLRVFNTGTVPADFTVCLEESAGPLNDSRLEAFDLVQEPVYLPETHTLSFATQSLAAEACGSQPAGVANNDVWFSFVANSDDPTIRVDNNFGPSLSLELFDTGLNLLDCFEPSFFNFRTQIEAAMLTPGTEYLIRVYSYDDDLLLGREGQFEIGVFGYEDMAVLPKPNNACATGTNLTSTGSERWLYAESDGDLVAGILDQEPMGAVTTGVYGFNGPVLRAADGRPYLTRSLQMSVETQPTGPTRMALFFTAAELTELETALGGFFELSELRLTKFSISACSPFLPFAAGELVTPLAAETLDNGDVILIAEVDGFSSFFVHTGEAPLVAALSLPVECTDFSAEVTRAGHRLRWTTAAEDGHAAWDVETSTDGRSWRTAERLEPTEAAPAGRAYAVTVRPEGKSDVYYYRLVAESLDGAREPVCGIRTLADVAAEPVGLFAYPNPTDVGGRLSLRVVNLPDAAATLTLLDPMGRPVVRRSLAGGASPYVLDLPVGLAAGLYTVRVQAGGVDAAARVVVR